MKNMTRMEKRMVSLGRLKKVGTVYSVEWTLLLAR